MKKFKDIKNEKDLKFNLQILYKALEEQHINDNQLDNLEFLEKLFKNFDKTQKYLYDFLDYIGFLKEEGIFAFIDNFIKNRNQYKDIYKNFDVLVKLDEKILNQIREKK